MNINKYLQNEAKKTVDDISLELQEIKDLLDVAMKDAIIKRNKEVINNLKIASKSINKALNIIDGIE